MSKKDAQQMQEMEAEFLQGAQERGHAIGQGQGHLCHDGQVCRLWFQSCGHAYTYSALAFQLAYFKTHYPDVFFDIMLNYSAVIISQMPCNLIFRRPSSASTIFPYHDRFDKRQIYMGLKYQRFSKRLCLLDCGGGGH